MAADDLLEYYERELRYLRVEGAAFSQAHRDTAARLTLTDHASADPHVERLIESFAFLTGRIQRRLDADAPQIPAALLEQIYPQLVAPIPSMAIVEALLDPTQARPPGEVDLPRGATLFGRAKTSAGEPVECRLSTGWPLTLVPVLGGEVAVERPADHRCLEGRDDVAAVLRVRLRCVGRIGFPALGDLRLRLHLDGERGATGQIYESLSNQTRSVLVVTPEGLPLSAEQPAAGVWRPIGFNEDEALLPRSAQGHAAWRLLQEYFHFPEKFHFFDLNLGVLDKAASEIDLLFLLDQSPPPCASTRLLTNCVPALNLFPSTSEPLRVDRRTSDYLLHADIRRPRFIEIHSVIDVTTTQDGSERPRLLAPFFSLAHGPQSHEAPLFWTARRESAAVEGLTGTRMLLSFTDRAFGSATPDGPIVFAHMLCTNRGLAEQLPPGAALEVEEHLPIRGLRCIARPTRQIDPPLRGRALWRLLSSLGLNALSLSGGPEALTALREILTLYGHGAPVEASRQAEGITSLEARPATRRVASAFGEGFVRGLHLTLRLNETTFAGRNPLLFAAVLDRVLSLHAAMNSFTQLDLRTEAADGWRETGERPWATFPPRAGARAIL